MINCPTQDLLERLLADDLAETEESELEQHLQTCSDCRGRLERLTSVDVDLQDALERSDRGDSNHLSRILEELKISPPTEEIASAATVAHTPREHGEVTAGSEVPDVPSLPGYEVLGELGRGGLGIVFRARQIALGRLVAIKMVIPSAVGEKELARFRLEARAVAKLQHPNVVQVLDVIEHGGQPYLAMELVPGGNLADQLQGQPQPSMVAAKIVETLARAVDVVHEQEILHRDLKPSNVLLNPADASSGIPISNRNGDTDFFQLKISDFGLAKQIGKDSGLTSTHAILGTPSYMPPEQAQLRTTLGRTADVYALGAILYEMLTGKPPFQGTSVVETLTQIIHDEPVRPSRLLPSIPRDLEAVCLKCLEKDPAKRYGSAIALAEDLHRVQEGRPTVARPTRLLGRTWRWARRSPVVAGLVGVLALTWIVATVALVILTLEARSAANLAAAKSKEAKQKSELASKNAAEAKKRAIEATDEKERANDAAYVSSLRLVQLAWKGGNKNLVSKELDRQIPKADTSDRRGFEWFYWRHLTRKRPPDQIWKAHDQAVSCMGYSPDGKFLATGSVDKTVKIWELETGKKLREFPPQNELIVEVRFSRDSKRLASRTFSGKAKLFDLESGKELQKPNQNTPLLCLWFDGDDQCQGAFSREKTLWCRNIQTDAEKKLLPELDERVRYAKVHVDDRLMLTGSLNGGMFCWDLDTGRKVSTLKMRKGFVQKAAFSHDGRRVAVQGLGNDTQVWDVRRGQLLFLSRGHRVHSLLFAPQPTRLLGLISINRNMMQWLIDQRAESMILPDLAGVYSFSFTPNGKRLVLGCSDGFVRIWETQQLRTVRKLDPSGELMQVRFLGTEQLAVARDGDGVVVMDINSGRESFSAPLPGERIFKLVGSPNGKVLAVCVNNGTIRLWDVTTKKELPSLVGHQSNIRDLFFTEDGRRLVSGSSDKTIRVWDVESAKLMRVVKGETPVVSCAISKDGKVIAGAYQNREIKLWDGHTGGVLATLEGFDGDIRSVRVSPDGRIVACASGNKVSVWDRMTAKKQSDIEGHGRRVSEIDFSPDGRRLVTGSYDGTVKLWDIATGQEVLTLDDPKRPVESVTFSRDGRRIACVNPSEVVVWEAPQ